MTHDYRELPVVEGIVVPQGYQVIDAVDLEGPVTYAVVNHYTLAIERGLERKLKCLIAVLNHLASETEQMVSVLGEDLAQREVIHKVEEEIRQKEEQRLSQEEEKLRCDVCATWVGTHYVTVGRHVIHVCDKPKCQDEADDLLRQEALLEQERKRLDAWNF